MAERSFTDFDINQLESLSKQAQDNPDLLAELRDEAAQRRGQRAAALVSSINATLEIATRHSNPAPPDGSEGISAFPQLAEAVERIRRKLLDLTLRNPLLSFSSRRRRIQVIDEIPDQLYRQLLRGDEMTLKPVPSPEAVGPEPGARPDLPIDPEGSAIPAGTQSSSWSRPPRRRSSRGSTVPVEDAARSAGLNPKTDLPLTPSPERSTDPRHADRFIQTLHYSADLERIGAALAKESQLLIDETGANLLQLVFGFLEWQDIEGGQSRLAPLILFPAVLTRRIVQRHGFEYLVRQADDDASANVSLQEKLKQEFGITVPDFDEDLGPAQYFAAVAEAIAGKQSWAVRGGVSLCLLEFGKILMHKDLDRTKWPQGGAVDDHPIIQRLFGAEASGEQSIDSDFAEDYDLIGTDAEVMDPLLVLEADSSQHSALLDATRGRSLVVEGPPGTGKSQTIANLIGASLAAGKTVLFMAEKRAALEVVHNRLVEAGLGPFLLELHSDRVTKKRVAQHLLQRLKLCRTQSYPPHLDRIRQALLAEKSRLTAYASLLGAPLGDLGFSVHDGLWKVNRLRRLFPECSERIERLTLPGVAQINAADHEIGRSRLAECGALLLRVADQPNRDGRYPWEGINTATVDALDLPVVRPRLSELGAVADDVASALEAVAEMTGLEIASSPSRFDSLRRGLNGLPHDPMIPVPGLFYHVADQGVAADARALATDLAALHAKANEVKAAWPMSFAHRDRFPSLICSLEAASAYVATSGSIADVPVRASEWNMTTAMLERAMEAMLPLSEALPGLRSPTVRDLGTIDRILTPLRGIRAEAAGRRFDGLTIPGATEVLLRHGAEIMRLRAQRDELTSRFRLDLAPLTRDVRRAVAVLASTRWWERLGAPYRAARRLHRTVARNGTWTHASALADCEELARHLAAMDRLQHADGIESVAGPFQKGIDTPWEDLHALAVWWQALDAEAAVRPVLATSLHGLWKASDAWFGTVVARATEGSIVGLCASSRAALNRIGQFLPDDASLALAEASGEDCLLGTVADHCRAAGAHLIGLANDLDGCEFPAGTAVATSVGLLAKAERVVADGARLSATKTFQTLIGTSPGALEVDLSALLATLHLSDAVRRSADQNPEFGRVVGWCRAAEFPARTAALRQWVGAFDVAQRSLLQAEDQLLAALDADQSAWYGDGATSSERPYAARWRRAAFAASRVEDFATWVAFARCQVRAAACPGGRDLVTLAQQVPIIAERLGDAYSLIVLGSVIRGSLRGNAAIDGLTGEVLDQIRRRFAATDRELLEANQALIAHTIDQRSVPLGNDAGPVAAHTELALVRRESEKGTRHVPLRQLMARAGRALQALCPCWMMSPLSVARFCDPRKVQFDLLIMDEASQLRPEDALGAIARARQVVIVGDRKQLPPTSFFQTVDDDEPAEGVDPDEDLGAGVNEAESILEVASTTLRPPRTLRWHYRSRHESLIAFSNRHFYGNRLVVFPSPRTRSEGLGVRFEFVAGAVYTSSLNHREAQRIVELVAEHCARRASKSLGIVTMNSNQRDLVSELLDEAVRTDPAVRSFVESRTGALDSLIVKNLENIQGDERDVIIVSVTYGPDQNGNLYQRFGPVAGAQGARRLNVLFTRARDQVVVVSSMRGSGLRVDATTPAGTRALKEYLEYAESGVLSDIWVSGRPPATPFELEVADALHGHGFETAAQIGVAGYFVDLAVRDPNHPGRFLLGVECDGATYHSAKSARDRDRLRQQHLEAMGWTLHRIWSTDWFQRPKAELSRLVASIQSAAEGMDIS